MQYNTGVYNRSIEFFDDTTGICGAFSSSGGPILFKTTDAGTSWQNITPSLGATVTGICGLAIADSSTVYACGVWSKPAYLFKSTDRGGSWQYIDMSSYAQTLIDMEFLNKDTGFAVGSGTNDSLGGTILYTTNGGSTWSTLYNTNVYQDIIWKIQRLDKKHFYASVEAAPSAGNTRILMSNNGGMNWSSVIVDSNYYDMQAVGFMDTLKGWAGGQNRLYETVNGGTTWNQITLGSTYNRFFKIHDSLAFLTGVKIYKYANPAAIGMAESSKHDDIHHLAVSPNPTSGKLNITIAINTPFTFCQLKILNVHGRMTRLLNNSNLNRGEYNFEASLTAESRGIYFLVLHTHEGLIYKKIVLD